MPKYRAVIERRSKIGDGFINTVDLESEEPLTKSQAIQILKDNYQTQTHVVSLLRMVEVDKIQEAKNGSDNG